MALMRVVTSLTNRIFLACTLLAALSLGFAFYFVNARMTDQAEAELRRGLTDAAALVDQFRLTLLDRYTRDARLIADLSNLKAAVETNDPPTVQPLAENYRTQVNADVIVISSAPSLRNHGQGRVLASIGSDGAALPIIEGAAATSDELSVFLPHNRGILQVTSVPIFQFDPDRGDKDVLGRLTLGFFLDDARAGTFKALTGSDVAFSANGRLTARHDHRWLSATASHQSNSHARLAGMGAALPPRTRRSTRFGDTHGGRVPHERLRARPCRERCPGLGRISAWISADGSAD